MVLLTSVTGCSVIDEDLSDCVDVEQEKLDYELDYELRLVTNMTTELTTQLTTQTDIRLADALKKHLDKIFTDYAHDVDLSFYDTRGNYPRIQHDEHFMDANQASYTLNLPMRQYMHLATANILDNESVTLKNDDYCYQSMLSQAAADTINSHTTGVFTARQPMEVLEGIDQSFNVHLYMANCAASLSTRFVFTVRDSPRASTSATVFFSMMITRNFSGQPLQQRRIWTNWLTLR